MGYLDREAVNKTPQDEGQSMIYRLFDIQRASMVDGPGIRTTFFFKGCNLRCAWCHNPESQNARPELLVYPGQCSGCGACKKVCPHPNEACTGCGSCAEVCPTGARRLAGRDYSADELLKIAMKDRDYYICSGGGVTFSGGESMLYPDEVAELAARCQENGIATAVDTAGCVPWEHFEKVTPYADLFLYDIKSMEDETHRRFTGVGNTLILANYRKLIASGKRVWVRVPVIPGVNDGEENLLLLRELFAAYPPEKIECLPYHRMGEGKYVALGREVPLFTPPTKEKMQKIKAIVDPMTR